MDEALARSMQAQFASGTSTTRPIVNRIETDLGNNRNNNNATESATGSSTGFLGIIPDVPSGNSGEHVINRETSKRIYSSNIYTL